jgi:hypothetical protein
MHVVHKLPYQNTLLDMEDQLQSLDFIANRDCSAGHPFSPKNEDDLFDRIGHLERNSFPGSLSEPVVEG